MRAPVTRGAAEEVPEDVSEDVAEVSASAEPARPEPAHALDPREAVLVVGRALLRVGQHLVGLRRLLELLGGFMVVLRVLVRMVLHRKTAVRLLYFRLVRVLMYAEYFVVVALGQLLYSLL